MFVETEYTHMNGGKHIENEQKGGLYFYVKGWKRGNDKNCYGCVNVMYMCCIYVWKKIPWKHNGWVNGTNEIN